MTDVLHIAGLIGATLIITSSTLFSPIRRLWPALLACPQCVGLWIGAAAGSSGIVYAGHGALIDAVVVGSATSFLAQLADALLTRWLGPTEDKKDTDQGDAHATQVEKSEEQERPL